MILNVSPKKCHNVSEDLEKKIFNVVVLKERPVPLRHSEIFTPTSQVQFRVLSLTVLNLTEDKQRFSFKANISKRCFKATLLPQVTRRSSFGSIH